MGAFNEDKEKSWPSTIIGESMIGDCSVCMARTIKKAAVSPARPRRAASRLSAGSTAADRAMRERRLVKGASRAKGCEAIGVGRVRKIRRAEHSGLFHRPVKKASVT